MLAPAAVDATVHLARHDVRCTRRGALGWSAGFVVFAATVVVGYRDAYPTVVQRQVLARQLASNLGFQAMYGRAGDLVSIGGFTAWRAGGIMVVLAMVWGLLTVTRLGRGDEDTGRAELLLGGAITRARWVGVTIGVALGWQVVAASVLAAVLVALGLPVGGAALFAASVAGCGALGVGLGAVAAQVWPTRRRAAGIAGALVGAAFVVRVLSDGTHRLGWARWATPFGWSESTFAWSPAARAWPLAPLLGTALALGVAAVALGRRRDLGGAWVAADDVGPAGATRLHGAGGLEVRLGWRAAVPWAASCALGGVVLGLLASDVAKFARDSPGYIDTVKKLGIADPGRPGSFIGLSFSIVAVVVAVYGASAMIAARETESSGRLTTLAVQPVTRRRWMCLRGAVAVVCLAAICTLAGFAAWLGTVVQGDAIGLVQGLGAGWNMFPLGCCVLGLTALAFGLAPRWTAAVGIGLIAGGYVLEIVAALLRWSHWIRDLTPFQHLTPYPAAPVHWTSVLVLTLVGVAGVGVGAVGLQRRDERSA